MTMMRSDIDVLSEALARIVTDAPRIARSEGTLALFLADVRLVANLVESGWDHDLLVNIQECLGACLGGEARQ
jgi:hypothetical protein